MRFQLCVCVAAAVAVCVDAAVGLSAADENDMRIVGDRLRAQYQTADGCHEICPSAAADVASLLPNGSWADVNYTDQSRTVWAAMGHWNKLVDLTRGFLCPACTANSTGEAAMGDAGGVYNSTAALDAIFRACDFWIAENFQDPNWWFNDIGMPMTAIKVYLLLDGAGPRGPDGVLSPERLKAGDLLWAGADGIWPTMTGENRIWTRTIVMQKGLLHKNLSSVVASFDDLFSTVVVETSQASDGIMPDGSFHQHGSLLQSGSYGAGFFENVASLFGLAQGTQFVMSEARGNAYATFVLDGEQWMLRTYPAGGGESDSSGSNGHKYYSAAEAGGLFANAGPTGSSTGGDVVVKWDLSAKGREITRTPGSLAAGSTVGLAQVLRNMTFAGRGDEFQAFAARLVEVPSTAAAAAATIASSSSGGAGTDSAKGSGGGQDNNGSGSSGGSLHTSTELVGDRHFHLSDFHVHRERGWTVGVRTFSQRTRSAECVNAEGQTSWHMSDGLTTVNVYGDEFDGVFPVWDWVRLPGITGWVGGAPETPCSTVNQFGQSSFVGGVSDGVVGAAAFAFRSSNFYASSNSNGSSNSNSNNNYYNSTQDSGAAGSRGSRASPPAAGAPFAGQVTANKAWFFWPGGFVALGANISGTSPPLPQPSAAGGASSAADAGGGPMLTTTLNQALLHGPVTTSGGSALPQGAWQDASGAAWVHHNGVGYVLGLNATATQPQPRWRRQPERARSAPRVRAAAMPQNGSWSLLNPAESSAPVSLPVFSLEIVHSSAAAPAAATRTGPAREGALADSAYQYAYAVLPGVPNASAMSGAAAAFAADVAVAANSAAVQAVRFFEPGSSSGGGAAAAGTLQVVVYDNAAAGTVDGGGAGWRASNFSAPCAVQVRVRAAAATEVAGATGGDTVVSIAVADPAQTNATGLTMSFVLDRVLTTRTGGGGGTGGTGGSAVITCTPRADGATSTVTAAMPSGVHAGASVTGSCVQQQSGTLTAAR